ncbi:MAG: hypothetical protein WD894_22905 [Pirellulales bacterium]
MLAITVAFDNMTGVLSFTGDASDDTLVITANDSTSSDVSFFSATDMSVTAESPKSGVTAVRVNLGDGTNDTLTILGSNDADTISINGTTVTFVSALAVDVSYTLTDVESLFVNGQANHDTISVTGASVTGELSFSGGPGADELSVSGPFAAGTLTVEDPDTSGVELSGSAIDSILTTADQTYDVSVLLGADTTLTGKNISFNDTVDSSGANRSLEINTSGGGTTTFAGRVGSAVPLGSITTNSDGTTFINGSEVSTIGDQTFNDPTTLDSSTEALLYAINGDSRTVNEHDTSGRLLRSFTVEAPDSLRGIAVGPDGLLYASYSLYESFGVVAFDATGEIHETYTYAGYWLGLKTFGAAGRIAFDRKGHFYVDGFQFEIGRPDSGRMVSALRTDVEILPNGNLLLADDYGLYEVTPSGTTVRTISSFGTDGFANIGTGGFAHIRGVEYDQERNHIYVTMLGYYSANWDFTHRILKLDGTTGALLNNTRYPYPVDLFLTDDRRLLVGSWEGPAAIFDLELNQIGTFAGGPRQFVTQSRGQFTRLDSTSGNVTFNSTLAGLQNDEEKLEIKAGNDVAFNATVGGSAGGRFGDLYVAAANEIRLTEVHVTDRLDLTATAGRILQDGDAAPDVLATTLNLRARGGINLDTSVETLTANNEVSGDIVISESFGINVLSATNDGGNIQIVAAGGPMNVTTIDSAGFFVGSTSDTAAAGDTLLVTGNVQAQSFVSLVAGDDMTLLSSSDVRSVNSFVYMKLDAASVDTAGGTLVLLGSLRGNNSLQYPLVAEGGIQDDLFSIQRLPQSPIAILARAGALDNTFIVFTDAAEDIRVFATIVDLVGQPGIEITYVDNEQLDLVTQGGDDKVFVQMPEPIHGILANIIRTSTGAGDDSLKVNGSTLNDVIRVSSYTTDPDYRFQVRGDTGETECLQVFGFMGNDIIENAAPIAALLDGGHGQDAITGSDFSIHPVTGAEIYDVIFGGGDADSLFDPVTGRAGLSGRAGNDFIYADHDYNLGMPVLTLSTGDMVNGGVGLDVIIALGADFVRRDQGAFDSDIILNQEPGISAQLQAGLGKKCARLIP